MTSRGELIARLRAIGGYFDDAALERVSLKEVSDAIEALQDRLADVEKERDEARDKADHFARVAMFHKEDADEEHARAISAEKESDELREWHMAAEMELSSSDPNYTPLLDKYTAAIQAYADRALAAEQSRDEVVKAAEMLDVQDYDVGIGLPTVLLINDRAAYEHLHSLIEALNKGCGDDLPRR